MEGPRAVKPEEMPSLSELVDTVFRGAPGNIMFSQYPQLFNEANRENLLVFVDGGKVVSHYGMVQRWGSLCGCTVRTSCVGSVATYESHRGQRLASKLMEANVAKATADGADFAMISGGRGLYRTNGAVDFGFASAVRVDAAQAAALADVGVSAMPLTAQDIGACSALYASRATRFVRPLDDWRWFLQSGRSMNKPAKGFVLRRNGAVCGYLIVAEPNAEGVGYVTEFAGNDWGIAGGLACVLNARGAQCVQLNLEGQDGSLAALLAGVGCEQGAPAGSCTVMLLNFPQLMQRLRPWLALKAGMEAERAMAFSQPEENVYVFRSGAEEVRLEGRAAAAEFIFQPGDTVVRAQPWNAVFPVPTLWYGLNYA